MRFQAWPAQGVDLDTSHFSCDLSIWAAEIMRHLESGSKVCSRTETLQWHQHTERCSLFCVYSQPLLNPDVLCWLFPQTQLLAVFTLMVSSGCPAKTRQTPPKPPAKKFFIGLIGCGCLAIFTSRSAERERETVTKTRQNVAAGGLDETRGHDERQL